jgi:ATP-binding cassette subfamily F protein 3
MSILTANSLAKSYGPQDVFEGVSLEIPKGAKIALVGPNGSGKTTLLHLLAGLEQPTAGEVHRAKGLGIAYLPQQADFHGVGTLWDIMLEVFADLRAQAAELRSLETAMADPAIQEEALERYGRAQEAFELAGGYTYEQRIKQVLTGLGFAEDDLQCPVTQLSGGQKTRALLAQLLLEEPDLLLLDEPTNHLDLAGVEWLEGYLTAWAGAVVVVAHDRAFLDAVVDRVWDLAWGGLEQYRGNYSAYACSRPSMSGSSNLSIVPRSSSAATWPGSARARPRGGRSGWSGWSASIGRGSIAR